MSRNRRRPTPNAPLLRRERDDSDRRKVFIAPVPERMMEIGRFYQLMQRAIEKQAAGYTDAELTLLLRYATESYQSILTATTELKEMMEAGQRQTPPASRSRHGRTRQRLRTIAALSAILSFFLRLAAWRFMKLPGRFKAAPNTRSRGW